MTNEKLMAYWALIPCDDHPFYYINQTGEHIFSSFTYEELQFFFSCSRRTCREILAELSAFDSGDDYILIRSSHNGGGFYKTRDHAKIEEYRKEVYNRAMNTLKPLKKIKRVLNRNEQITIDDLLMFGVND